MNPIAWVILIIVLIGALPTWPYSHEWGYYPSGGAVLLILVVAVVFYGRKK